MNLMSFLFPLAKQYSVKDVVEGIEYEFRVAAINFSGTGEPSSPSEFVIARDPKSESTNAKHNDITHLFIIYSYF